jgi:hypothetical protein
MVAATWSVLLLQSPKIFSSAALAFDCILFDGTQRDAEQTAIFDEFLSSVCVNADYGVKHCK